MTLSRPTQQEVAFLTYRHMDIQIKILACQKESCNGALSQS